MKKKEKKKKKSSRLNPFQNLYRINALMTHITITLALCIRYSCPFKSNRTSLNSANPSRIRVIPIQLTLTWLARCASMIRYCSYSKHPFLLSIHNPESCFLFKFALHCTTSSTRQYNVDTPRLNLPKSPSVLRPMPSVLQTTSTLVAYSNYPFPLGFIHSSFLSWEFQTLPACPSFPEICKMGATQKAAETGTEFGISRHYSWRLGVWACERERERQWMYLQVIW